MGELQHSLGTTRDVSAGGIADAQCTSSATASDVLSDHFLVARSFLGEDSHISQLAAKFNKNICPFPCESKVMVFQPQALCHYVSLVFGQGAEI